MSYGNFLFCHFSPPSYIKNITNISISQRSICLASLYCSHILGELSRHYVAFVVSVCVSREKETLKPLHVPTRQENEQ